MMIVDCACSSLNLMCNNEQDSHDVAALMEKLVVMSKSRRGDTEVAFLHRQVSQQYHVELNVFSAHQVKLLGARRTRN
jgi:hypothetical protein